MCCGHKGWVHDECVEEVIVDAEGMEKFVLVGQLSKCCTYYVSMSLSHFRIKALKSNPLAHHDVVSIIYSLKVGDNILMQLCVLQTSVRVLPVVG